MGLRMPADIAEAITGMDADSANWSDETRARWARVRKFCFRRDNDSQRALPAFSRAAQEAVLARDHAQKAIEAMDGYFGDSPDADDDQENGS